MIRLGGIELGGTTCIVSFAINSPLNILCDYEIPTTTPEETLHALCGVLYMWSVDSIGVASFGPVALEGEFYGYITATPKLAWANFNVVEYIRQTMLKYSNGDYPLTLNVLPAVPDRIDSPQPSYKDMYIGFNTDVNGAALAEKKYGQHPASASTIAYITVGTGIGGGIVTSTGLIGGATHPELGHVYIKKHKADATFEGVCPFHGDCLEGLSTNKSLAARLHTTVDALPTLGDEQEYNNVNIWELEAYYLGQICSTLFLTVCPDIIVLGGGVMNRPGLLQKVQKATLQHINGYIASPNAENIASSIVESKQQGDCSPGVVGALLLALE